MLVRLSALAEKALMPFFNDTVVQVTVDFDVLQVIVFLVAPVMTMRYFDAPAHLRNVTLTVRPLKVHFAERRAGVAITTGVSATTTGTVTTGDDAEPTSDSLEEPTVVVVGIALTKKLSDCGETPSPAKLDAMTPHMYSPVSVGVNDSEDAPSTRVPSLNHA